MSSSIYNNLFRGNQKIFALLIDPENQNANIYLPRAIKRQKAIESLQGR